MQSLTRQLIYKGFNDVYQADNLPEKMVAANKLANMSGFTDEDKVRLTKYMEEYIRTTPTTHNLQGGKRRRTCRKRILNKNMKPMHKSMHKSMHRGRCGKRRSFRKY